MGTHEPEENPRRSEDFPNSRSYGKLSMSLEALPLVEALLRSLPPLPVLKADIGNQPRRLVLLYPSFSEPVQRFGHCPTQLSIGFN